MEITNKNIDHGKAFDWGKTSEDYAKYRDIYPKEFYAKLAELIARSKGTKCTGSRNRNGCDSKKYVFLRRKMDRGRYLRKSDYVCGETQQKCGDGHRLYCCISGSC